MFVTRDQLTEVTAVFGRTKVCTVYSLENSRERGLRGPVRASDVTALVTLTVSVLF